MEKCIKIISLAIFLSISFYLNAQDIDLNVNEDLNIETTEETSENDNIDYDKTGVILSISAFNYFSIGLGFNKGEWYSASHHFGGYNYGILIEYKTINELHLRIYGNIYGGVSTVHLGLSGIICTDFNNITIGISPEFGLGIPGGSLFYRYNIYLDKDYNCHEIVLLIYPLNKIFNSRRIN